MNQYIQKQIEAFRKQLLHTGFDSAEVSTIIVLGAIDEILATVWEEAEKRGEEKAINEVVEIVGNTKMAPGYAEHTIKKLAIYLVNKSTIKQSQEREEK